MKNTQHNILAQHDIVPQRVNYGKLPTEAEEFANRAKEYRLLNALSLLVDVASQRGRMGEDHPSDDPGLIKAHSAAMENARRVIADYRPKPPTLQEIVFSGIVEILSIETSGEWQPSTRDFIFFNELAQKAAVKLVRDIQSHFEAQTKEPKQELTPERLDALRKKVLTRMTREIPAVELQCWEWKNWPGTCAFATAAVNAFADELKEQR